MIIIFICYSIILFWLLESFSNSSNIIIEKSQDVKITIIIDEIKNVGKLILTLDSIRLQKYDLNKINLILLDSSSNDIESIIDHYKHDFLSINIFKTLEIDKLEILNDSFFLYERYLLLINCGTYMNEHFFKILSNHVQQTESSITYFPILNKDKNRYQVFHQIYFSFIELMKCSLVNKYLYLPKKNIVISKDYFIEFINEDIKIYNSQCSLVLPELCLYEKAKVNFNHLIHINMINIIYLGINVLFIFILIIFLTTPSMYLLAMIIIKILPELVFIYTFYNKEKIKFPKIDIIIFSVVSPFYFVMEFCRSMKLFKE